MSANRFTIPSVKTKLNALGADGLAALLTVVSAIRDPHPARNNLFRREPGQVADAQLLLDGGDLLDRLLEALFAEQSILFLLELFAKFLELLGRHDFVQCRKQHRILASLVRAVHAN